MDVYNRVVAYEDRGSPSKQEAVYVDMAGDADVRDAVHQHYGPRLVHSAVVGATHHDRIAAVPDSLPGPRPMFFFAPDRRQAHEEWGRDGVERRSPTRGGHTWSGPRAGSR